jgi:hypothetical protein
MIVYIMTMVSLWLFRVFWAGFFLGPGVTRTDPNMAMDTAFPRRCWLLAWLGVCMWEVTREAMREVIREVTWEMKKITFVTIIVSFTFVFQVHFFHIFTFSS